MQWPRRCWPKPKNEVTAHGISRLLTEEEQSPIAIHLVGKTRHRFTFPDLKIESLVEVGQERWLAGVPAQPLLREHAGGRTVYLRKQPSRDTTSLNLVMNDSLVTGFLTLRPYEKDQAQGSLSGTRSGEAITADWQRAGEGITQTHALNLTLSGDTLRWREGERVEEAGKWVLKTPDAGFEYVLTKTDCARP